MSHRCLGTEDSPEGHVEPMGVPENCCQPRPCSAWPQLQFRPHQGEGGRSRSPLTRLSRTLFVHAAGRARAGSGPGSERALLPGVHRPPALPRCVPSGHPQAPLGVRVQWGQGAAYPGWPPASASASPGSKQRKRVEPVPEFSCKGGVGGSNCGIASGWGK